MEIETLALITLLAEPTAWTEVKVRSPYSSYGEKQLLQDFSMNIDDGGPQPIVLL